MLTPGMTLERRTLIAKWVNPVNFCIFEQVGLVCSLQTCESLVVCGTFVRPNRWSWN